MEVFTGCNMFDIDDVCNKNISYDLNFFIGNICDLITVDSEDEEAVNPYNTLNIIQKKIKYGVSTQTAISICEKVFNDRIIATKIAEVLKNEQMCKEVLEYRGLYDLTKTDIHFGDTMVTYGKIEK
jgi:hypothetical protein